MVEVYADDGISGTNTAKRDEFNRMIADCEAGKIDLILTKSISRFSRNTLDCLKYTRKLKALNIAVFFEKENINTMDSKGKVLLTIMASLAQQESESLSANVRMGIQFRNQQGKVQINHNWFLGYTKDADGNLIIDPAQAEIVRCIYREYLEGASMNVKAEIARRANLNPDGKRRVYSSKYALSGMVFCGHCGDIYRRVKWNNRGCKSTVWRCVSRVLKGKMDFDCPARTVKEEVLHGAIVTAVNDAYARRNAVISLLKTNIRETVFDDLEARVAAIDEQLAELQQQMVENSGNHELVEELADQIDDLREDRQDILAEAAERTDLQARINDMIAFLEEMPAAVTEYSEALTRRLVKRITIFDEKIVVELKSSLQMEVEE